MMMIPGRGVPRSIGLSWRCRSGRLDLIHSIGHDRVALLDFGRYCIEGIA